MLTITTETNKPNTTTTKKTTAYDAIKTIEQTKKDYAYTNNNAKEFIWYQQTQTGPYWPLNKIINEKNKRKIKRKRAFKSQSILRNQRQTRTIHHRRHTKRTTTNNKLLRHRQNEQIKKL